MDEYLSENHDFTNYRQAYRMLNKLKMRKNIDQKTLDTKIDRSTKELQALKILFKDMENNQARSQNEIFYKRATQLAADWDHINFAIKLQKIQIEQLKSQILHTDNEFAKYSTTNGQDDAEKDIEKLENRFFNNNHKKSSLKAEANHLQIVISDLLLKRRTFQAARNSMITQLMANKYEIKKICQQ